MWFDNGVIEIIIKGNLAWQWDSRSQKKTLKVQIGCNYYALSVGPISQALSGLREFSVYGQSQRRAGFLHSNTGSSN